MYNLFGLFSLVLFLLSTTLYAESFVDFKRVQTSSFDSFNDKNDAKFSSYLQKQWEGYTKYVKVPLYLEPKPKKIIEASLQKQKAVGPVVTVKLKKGLEKKNLISSFENRTNKDFEIEYFGTSLNFNVAQGVKNAKYYPFTQKGIYNFYTTLAKSNYDLLLQQLDATAKKLELNDWGLFLLVKAIAVKLYTNRDEVKLFEWFILNKLQYRVKVALAKKHIVLLIDSKELLYGVARYYIDNTYYYVVESERREPYKEIFTYKNSYPKANKSFDFSLVKLPQFKKDIRKKSLYFVYNKQEYTVSFRYNQNLLDFFAMYPQVAYKIYFSTAMESETYFDVAQSLKKYIDGMKASVALDFLLKFVQKSFIYEVDSEQFNKEKVMFAEETLVYNKSDCEDRAILYAYLVRELLGIGVIGVKYQNHMATALYIPLKGDSVKVGRRRYVIADPTYINANVGMSMPKYRSIKPEKFIFF